MAVYKSRSDYYENIAHQNKLIAHKRPVSEGSDKLRKCFHRINSEEELNSACQNWGHFPCVVRTGFTLFGKNTGDFPGNCIKTDNLLFLQKSTFTGNVNKADQVEDAYDKAEQAMNQFISFMQNDFETNGGCGEFYDLDMSRVKAE
ncbi:MAG TPA: hypothetical protein PL045_00695, partial [Chitinophagaceae bacterium]|nr:hypothetical protein [Chitinophagaceae bacterium]